MKCPHCGEHFRENWTSGDLERASLKPSGKPAWTYRITECAACAKETIEIAPPERKLKPLSDRRWRQVYPVGSNRGPVPPEVPKPIADDYVEACQVLPLSAKSSAAMARRCLQTVLHEHGYKDKDLAKEVQQLLDETDPKKVLPRPIHDTVDAIRNFGNFSAHPITDKTSLQVIDVEPQEAEWCLEIVEALFEHFYVAPAKAAAKKAALNAKLKAAGKPPSK